MTIINHMKSHRRKRHITLTDIAFLLGINSAANLSRCENGIRKPQIEWILVYHILFNTSIKKLYPQHKTAIEKRIINRIPELIKELEKQESTLKMQNRIQHLNDVFIRLTQKSL